jgi:hypothetical protein
MAARLPRSKAHRTFDSPVFPLHAANTTDQPACATKRMRGLIAGNPARRASPSILPAGYFFRSGIGAMGRACPPLTDAGTTGFFGCLGFFCSLLLLI